jgi:WD40 repeat protein
MVENGAPSAPTEGLPEGFLFPGQVLGDRYQIRSQLGKGGMGEVWRAFDLKLRVEVALKALLPEFFKDERRRDLLRREVRAAREVVSPNVCRIFDLIEVDGRELVSMEYVDGGTLLSLLAERGPLDLKEAQDIASQFLAGLEAIHHAGLVHRDVKPENIMITRAGRVVLMDFGLARGTESGAGTVSGTPAYMAPEQAAGLKVDARADVYSAGVVLAEMVSPEGIKDLTSRQSVWEGIRHEPPRVPDSPWAPVLKKAVAKEPDQRYNSAHTLTRALEDVTLRVEGAEDLHPYPGLASFTEEDAEYFFGREAEVEQMWRKLEGPARMLGLVGPSGAGKSSFLRAGMIPAATAGWACVVCMPRSDPRAALRRAVISELEGDTEALRQLAEGSDEASVSAVARWRRHRQHAVVIIDQFEELFTQNTPDEQHRFTALLGRLVLEADTFVLLSMRDDFLIHCNRHESLRPLFSELTPLDPPTGAALRRALTQPALQCGYRFEDDALVDEMLAEVEGERGALPLLAFAAARLWEKRDRETGLLTRQAYQDIGGVGGALARHAESTIDQIGHQNLPIVRELFRNLVTAEGTRAVRDWNELLSVFDKSITLSSRATRLRAAESRDPPKPETASTRHSPEISGDPSTRASDALAQDDRGGRSQPLFGQDGRQGATEEVLRQLIDARLLTSYEVREEDREPTRRVEIIHESLLANWPRLVRWRTQDIEGAQLRDELRQAARTWDEHGRTDDMLWTGSAYREFAVWRERYPGGLSELEEGFAQAMTSLATRRRRRRRVAAALALGLTLVIAAVFGTLWRRSVLETRRAEAAKLLALAQVQIEDDPTEALAYTTASLEEADSEEARVFALRLLWEGPHALELVPEGSGASPRNPVFSPDGGRLAAPGHSEEVRVWTAKGGDPPLVLLGHTSSPQGSNWAAWASDELLVTGHRNDGRVRAWAIPDGRLLRTIDFGGPAGWWVYGETLFAAPREDDAETGHVISHLLSWRLPDGEREALGSVDRTALGGTLIGFDRDGRGVFYGKGNEIFYRPLRGGEGVPDRLVGFHDNEATWGPPPTEPGRLWTRDAVTGEMRHWDLTRGEPSLTAVIPALAGAPEGCLPDPSGRWLTEWWDITPRGRQARVWDREAWPEARPLTLRRSGSWYGAGSAFQPAGDWLVVSTHAFTDLTFWPLRGAWPQVVDGYSGLFRPLAFSPDGRWLATSWPDKSLRLWPLPDRGSSDVKVFEFPDEVDPAETLWYSIASDPRGRYLFVVGNQDNSWLVPLDGSLPRKLESFSNETLLRGAAVSPSGRQVATAFFFGGGPKTLKVWDVETGELRLFDLPEGSSSKTGYERGISRLAFAGESTLYTAGDGGVRRWHLENGEHELVLGVESGRRVGFALGAGGRKALVWETDFAFRVRMPVRILDLATAEARALPAFGHVSEAVALDSSGKVAVTGDDEGIIRVGYVTSREPHVLVGHEGPIDKVAISPDLRWVASTGEDNTLRLWPMPDLDKPPLHTLPHDELIAKLKSLTNLRAVPDETSSTGWKIEVGPFPGWAEVPEW